MIFNEFIIFSSNNINVQNVTVTTGATLTLEAAGSVKLNPGFKVQPGGGFKINIMKCDYE